MNLYIKQLKVDFCDMLKQSFLLCLMVPVIFTFMLLSNSTFQDGTSFALLMVQFAMPAGYLTLTMTRVLITLPTCIGMGSTRRVFYFSNLLASLFSFALVSEASMLLTSAIFFFIERDAAVELGTLALSPQMWLRTVCLNVLAIGVGALLGILMGRFGRKVFYISLIIMVVLGGVVGGVSAVALGVKGINLNDAAITLILGGAATLGLLLYGLAYPQIRKLNV